LPSLAERLALEIGPWHMVTATYGYSASGTAPRGTVRLHKPGSAGRCWRSSQLPLPWRRPSSTGLRREWTGIPAPTSTPRSPWT